ncbi:hypothetical protein NEOLEDRAFT_1126206 [Neolentinus lepideus HHB14362 ss-1]|uniref:TM7S3/TM198-like domain-containing protein n=1 Tax=Neolentinus lepideus HHB14362 ss-1 TaxID=1314782 RepID=A0A165W390_9AGAM|nr:hypothetical protein NEOLEDRAFT_1126206 [Neolentinus lepideus HHB14362 ss-1]
MAARSARRVLLAIALAFLTAIVSVSAQSSPSSVSSTSSLSASTTLSYVTTSVTTTFTSHSGNQNIPITTVIPISFGVNVTVTPTASANASASATATSDPSQLATVIDPAFGVLGGILILTGIPTAFLGHRNRWTSFFLIGFYTLSLVCFVLIVRFGVLAAIHPPTKTIRGMFLLASVVAGVAGGAVTIFFWKATKYVIGAWGGFAFALWIQCFRNGGLISPIGYRWIMYIAAGVIGFVLCTIPKIHYHILLISTAFVGSTAFMLGIDCFTTANLKEFYMWNLGFKSLFPRFVADHIAFPVTQVMQIELGLMGAVALAGIAIQFRLIKVLRRKLKEIQVEQKRRDEEEEARAAERFADIDKERGDWERQHATLPKHARHDSNFSGMPLIKDMDMPGTPSSAELRDSTFTLVNGTRQRYHSGVSDFFAAPPSDDELKRAGRQSPGALPVLDLGTDIQEDVPKSFITNDKLGERLAIPTSTSSPLLDDIKRKEELLNEIQTIRKSLDALKGGTPAPSASSESRSRHASFTAGLNITSSILADATHLRPPRQPDPRSRIQSVELSSLMRASPKPGESIGRPLSAPLQNDDWDAYVRDRKLLQPPSGITPPIATTPISPTPRIAVPAAVAEALARRHKVESMVEMGEMGTRVTSSSSGGSAPSVGRASPARIDYFAEVARQPTPPSMSKSHSRKVSSSGLAPAPISPPAPAVTVLPPRKSSTGIPAPQSERPNVPRVITFEELAERHREKMRDLQAPLTEAAKQEADVAEAKAKWERAKAIEKEAVTRRQAEKAKEFAEKSERRQRSDEKVPEGKHVRSRTLSGDKLAKLSAPVTSSKRLSTMKVEDWQRHQEADKVPAQESSRRNSRALRSDGDAVPFPAAAREPGRPGHEKKRSTAPRAPPN